MVTPHEGDRLIETSRLSTNGLPTAIDVLRRVPMPIAAAVADMTAEYHRAKAKHGEHTLDGSLADDLLRIAALGEEYGEVCQALTYDKRSHDAREHERHLRDELIQVANVALTWASILGRD